MFTGDNAGGKLFEVLDEDGDVLGSFDTIEQACACAAAAPWFHGALRVRRDRGMVMARRADDALATRQRRANGWWLVDPAEAD